MDIITLFSKIDTDKIILASTIGASLGIVAGLNIDTENISKTYINMCMGMVYGGLAGTITAANPFMPYVIVLTVLGYFVVSDVNQNNNHQTNKSIDSSMPFLENH